MFQVMLPNLSKISYFITTNCKRLLSKHSYCALLDEVFTLNKNQVYCAVE